MHFDCLYCALNKPALESTLEHAVPQFMGGAQAPIQYKLRNVCATCNNRLGLHVDGSYAKSWFVTNALAAAARKYYSGPGKNQPLPLVCFGPAVIPGLQVPPDYVAEYWLGPSGETIIWVRTKDDALYWYTGGNPTRRKRPSTVYFMPVSGEHTRLEMGVEALIAAYKKTKARRIFGATLVGPPAGTAYPGFDLPDPVDDANLQAIRAAIASGHLPARPTMNVQFDKRFICKIALGVGFSLFGASYLFTSQASEARLGLWPNPPRQPVLRGSPTLFNNPLFAQVAGYEGAVVLLVIPADGHYVLASTVDRGLPFVVEICLDSLSSPHVNAEEGYALVLFPQLQRYVQLTMAALIAHVVGAMPHPDLTAIDMQRHAAASFWSSLPPP